MKFNISLKIFIVLFLTFLILNTGCLSGTPTVTEAPSGGGGHMDVPPEYKNMVNPVSATQASLDRGLELFTENCEPCHGADGRGDGPKAMTLDRKPADFHSAHVQENTDGALFYMITKGIKEAKMPPFSGLFEEDRWNIVNYVRTFEAEEGASGGHNGHDGTNGHEDGHNDHEEGEEDHTPH